MHTIVRDANFGDSGKGLITDYLATNKTLVVLDVGGAQRGHTVQTPDGFRHVFHHFGSGTLKGAKTLLSSFFISNPYLFLKEYDILKTYMSQKPSLYYDINSLLTTPWDMMINQMAEEYRGDNRHGSCGIGINETIRRSDFYPITMGQINDFNFEFLLKNIQTAWVPRRLAQLNIPVSEEWKVRLNNPNVLDDYIQKAKQMEQLTNKCSETFMLQLYDEGHIIFEGAQGLLLDQHHEFFPHVTPSNTGIENAIVLLNKANITTPVEMVYMSRAYATRHGAGPFPREADFSYEDKTNVPNMWQKSLRFGYLDLDLMGKTIKADLEKANGYNIKPVIGITCLDQVGDIFSYYWNDIKTTSNAESFFALVEESTGLKVKYASYGPTRNDVKSAINV
jgi:adenylosuccinate synthase